MYDDDDADDDDERLGHYHGDVHENEMPLESKIEIFEIGDSHDQKMILIIMSVIMMIVTMMIVMIVVMMVVMIMRIIKEKHEMKQR